MLKGLEVFYPIADPQAGHAETKVRFLEVISIIEDSCLSWLALAKTSSSPLNYSLGGVQDPVPLRSGFSHSAEFSRLGAEKSFSFHARNTASPYIDNRPLLNPAQPELRQYKAIFVIADDEIGLQSDVAEGVCKP